MPDSPCFAGCCAKSCADINRERTVAVVKLNRFMISESLLISNHIHKPCGHKTMSQDSWLLT